MQQVLRRAVELDRQERLSQERTEEEEADGGMLEVEQRKDHSHPMGYHAGDSWGSFLGAQDGAGLNTVLCPATGRVQRRKKGRNSAFLLSSLPTPTSPDG